ncbi:Heterokaryon incompatibility protein (HET) domain containing protein [Rhypophila decipiens]
MPPFDPSQIDLPKQAARAKTRFDRLDFREPGNVAARTRKTHLEDEIKSLQEEEEKVRHKMAEMRNSYFSRAEADEVERSFLQMNARFGEMKPETQALCDRVGKQIDETKRALVQALAPRTSVNSEGKATSHGLERKKRALARCERDLKIFTLKVGNLDFDTRMVEQDLERLKQRLVALRKERASLRKGSTGSIDGGHQDQETEFSSAYDSDQVTTDHSPDQISSPTTERTGSEKLVERPSSHTSGDESHHNPDIRNTNETIQDKPQSESARAVKVSDAHLRQTENGEEHNSDSEREEFQSLKDEQVVGLVPQNGHQDLDEEGGSRGQEAQRNDSDDGKNNDQDDNGGIDAQNMVPSPMDMAVEEASKKSDGVASIDKEGKRAQKIESLTSEITAVRTFRDQLVRKQRSKLQEKESLKKKCNVLEGKKQDIEKDIAELSSAKDKKKGVGALETTNDDKWQLKKREDQKREIEELERQKQRDKALRTVRMESAKNLRNGAGFMERNYHVDRRNRVRWFRPQPPRMHRIPHRRVYYDSNSESDLYMADSDHWSSSQDSDSDDQENTEDNHLKSLRKIIDQVEDLEESIRTIRKLGEKLDTMVDFRVVLERELDLETSWLATQQLRAGQQSTISTSLNLVESGAARDHLTAPLSPSQLDFYKPLKRNEIRLLVVWPAKSDHHPLLCSLQTSSLGKGEQKPKYAALSYNWGSPLVNGRLYLVLQDDLMAGTSPDSWGSTARYALRIPIRNNLFRALLRLRRPDHPISLWVDLMCINQNDAVEKTDQLEQLIEIYRHADNVCIWLGESDDEGRSDEAMDFVTSIMDFAVLDRYATDPKQAKKWQGLAELMRDRWFSRRWVVQEISLARRATLHCGGKTVQWLDFADAVSLLASNQDTIKKLFDYKEWRDGPNTLGDVNSFGAYVLLEATSRLFLRTAKGRITKPVKKLEALVTSLKTFDATDQKDLIYSLVSIACDTPQSRNVYDQMAGETAELKVNYSNKAIDVYKDFTRFCLMSSNSLDILCRPWAMPIKFESEFPQDQPPHGVTLPSWIPMLSRSEFGNPEDVYSGRKNGENLVGPVDRPRYRACGDTTYDTSLISDAETFGENDILPMRGFKLARITRTSPRITGGVILRESIQMGGWKGIEHDTVSVPDQIWRTLVADRDQDGQIPPTWYQRACLRCLEIADTFNNGDLNISELLQGNSELIRQYLTRVRNVTWNRRFFEAISVDPRTGISVETETQPSSYRDHDDQEHSSKHESVSAYSDSEIDSNNYADDLHPSQEENNSFQDVPYLFGLGPPTIRENDLVCILDGCSVPIILRETFNLPASTPTPSSPPLRTTGTLLTHESLRELANATEPEPAAEYDVDEAINIPLPPTPPPVEPNGTNQQGQGPYMMFIGEAYVHGKMEGEALDDLKDGQSLGSEKEIFEVK